MIDEMNERLHEVLLRKALVRVVTQILKDEKK